MLFIGWEGCSGESQFAYSTSFKEFSAKPKPVRQSHPSPKRKF
jgi:hypothetical protein